MNILLITFRFSPCNAIGAKRWSEFYKLSLKDPDINLTILTANWLGKKIKDKNIYYLGDAIQYKPGKSSVKKTTLFDILRYPPKAFRSIDKSLLSSWYRATKKWLIENKDKNFDIIISSYWPAGSIYLGNKAKKIFKLPLFLDLRDLISIQGQKKKIFLLNQLDKIFDKHLNKNVDLFLTVSPTCTNKARKFYNKKVLTVYNGMASEYDNDKKLKVNIKKKIKILYTGSLGITRNPKFFLDILNEYCKTNKIEVVVKFASQDNPFDFIDKKNIVFDMEWLGYLNKKQLKKEKDKSNVFLLIEDQTKNGNENLTGKIFEYMLGKKPVMISCHPNSDIVKVTKFTNSGMLINSKKSLEVFFKSDFIVKKKKINLFSRKTQYENLKKNILVFRDN